MYCTWDCPMWAPSNTATEKLLPKILGLYPSTYLNRWKMALSLNTTLAVKKIVINFDRTSHHNVLQTSLLWAVTCLVPLLKYGFQSCVLRFMSNMTL